MSAIRILGLLVFALAFSAHALPPEFSGPHTTVGCQHSLSANPAFLSAWKQRFASRYFSGPVARSTMLVARRYGLEAVEVQTLGAYLAARPDTVVETVQSSSIEKPELDPVLVVLKSTLEKLPKHSGYAVRGVNLSAEELAKYQPGVEIQASEAMSASRFAIREGHQLIRIKSKTARVVRDFLTRDGQDELLFPPGTRFRVVSRKELRRTLVRQSEILIEMEEI